MPDAMSSRHAMMANMSGVPDVSGRRRRPLRSASASDPRSQYSMSIQVSTRRASRSRSLASACSSSLRVSADCCRGGSGAGAGGAPPAAPASAPAAPSRPEWPAFVSALSSKVPLRPGTPLPAGKRPPAPARPCPREACGLVGRLPLPPGCSGGRPPLAVRPMRLALPRLDCSAPGGGLGPLALPLAEPEGELLEPAAWPVDECATQILYVDTMLGCDSDVASSASRSALASLASLLVCSTTLIATMVFFQRPARAAG